MLRPAAGRGAAWEKRGAKSPFGLRLSGKELIFLVLPGFDMQNQMDWALHGRLAEVQDRIAKAAEKAARDPATITVVAITKTFPLEFARKAYALGVRHFGENRVQEAIEKWQDKRPLGMESTETLHLVGHLQRNKVRKAVQLFDRIDAVDSLELAEALSRISGELDRTMDILIEVNTSGEQQKFGVHPANTAELAFELSKLSNLKLLGLMTVGPLTNNISEIVEAYRLLKSLLDNLYSKDLVSGTVLSMGMSGDFEIAIAEGATEVRLGTVLFGTRSEA
jgi:pyridoxal phosphate enzyme (YggS family)